MGFRKKQRYGSKQRYNGMLQRRRLVKATYHTNQTNCGDKLTKLLMHTRDKPNSGKGSVCHQLSEKKQLPKSIMIALVLYASNPTDYYFSIVCSENCVEFQRIMSSTLLEFEILNFLHHPSCYIRNNCQNLVNDS